MHGRRGSSLSHLGRRLTTAATQPNVLTPAASAAAAAPTAAPTTTAAARWQTIAGNLRRVTTFPQVNKPSTWQQHQQHQQPQQPERVHHAGYINLRRASRPHHQAQNNHNSARRMSESRRLSAASNTSVSWNKLVDRVFDETLTALNSSSDDVAATSARSIEQPMSGYKAACTASSSSLAHAATCLTALHGLSQLRSCCCRRPLEATQPATAAQQQESA